MTKARQKSVMEEKDALPVSFAAKNHLLSQLLGSTDLTDSLLTQARIVSLERNQVLYEQGDKIESVYFPIDCIVSNLAIMKDGTTMETSMIGCEGFVGISAIFGSGLSKQWTWVSVSGSAVQFDAKLLEKIFLGRVDRLKALLRFYRSLIMQVSQRCVCNARHTVLERLCCWLLMVDDRAGGGNLRLTQEMIASRLGARRAGVTVAAGALHAMHVIDYRRGQLHITDRQVLEDTVCECYAIMKNGLRKSNPPQVVRRDRFLTVDK